MISFCLTNGVELGKHQSGGFVARLRLDVHVHVPDQYGESLYYHDTLELVNPGIYS